MKNKNKLQEIMKRAVGERSRMGRAAGSRVGKMNISAWVDPEVRSKLHLVQAKRPGVRLEELVKEALDLLVEKYKVA